MTDRDDHEPTDDEQRSELGEVLDSLKRPGSGADDSVVTGGQTRMSWRSVTDEAEEAPTTEAAAPDRSSFQFDLGSALQRLGGPADPDATSAPATEPSTPAAPLPTREPPAPEAPTDALPTREPVASEDAADPLPTREPVANEDAADPLPTREPVASEDAAASLPTREPVASQDSPEPLPTREPAVQPPAADPLPTRQPAARQDSPEPLPTREPAAQPPAADPLPTRRPAPQAEQPAAAAPPVEQPAPPADIPQQTDPEPVRRAAAPAASVFDDARPAPTLPTGAPTMPAAATETPAAPTISPADAAALPSLPAAVPAAPPTVEPIASATAANDINAVRSVQMRAQRDERKGKMFGRTFLALIVLAAAVGGALVFGRSLLFPTQWDAGLTAAVDAVQEDRGAEFPSTVPLQVAPDTEYAALALETWYGTDWSTRYAEWRALGIATGAPESEAVAAAIVAWRPAFYDPLTDTVYRAESATDEAAAPALQLALQEVFERQSGATPPEIDEPVVGVLSAGSEAARNARAIDRELLVGAAPTFTLDGAGAPLPLLVEMGVIDMFGDELVAIAADAGEPAVFGEPYPEAALTATAVDARRALSTLLPPDVENAGDPVAWGVEQWALVFDNRLPDVTVDRMTSIIVADAYRPVTRAGARCFVAQFQSTGPETSAELLGGLTRWAVGAPEGAWARATQLTPNTIELFACDPGPTTEMTLDRVAVDTALARLALAPPAG